MDKIEQAVETEVGNAPMESRQAHLPEKLWNELHTLFKENGRQAARQNKIVGHETTARRKESMVRSFRELRGLGYKLESVFNLQHRHILALTKHWEERKLSASTLANRISCLRLLAKWIGKPGMIQKSVDFVSDPNLVRRQQAATEDKSWSAKGVDAKAMIRLVEEYDWRVGLQLKLMLAFGLRMQEAVMFRPIQADLEFAIRVRDGTKGGRERVFRFETEWQRKLLDYAKTKVTSPNQSIAHPDMNLKQAKRRFYYVCEKFGVTKRHLNVTAHGLRAEHLCDLYEAVAGVPAPVRSANLAFDLNQATHDLARMRVSQEAGHARLAISSAYIGARRLPKESPTEIAKKRRLRELIAKEELDQCERRELVGLIPHSEVVGHADA